MANIESDSNQYDWQKPVLEALLELDPSVLQKKVADAETVIFERMQALADDVTHCNHAGERQALQDAANSLRVLKREILKFPDWRPD